MALEGGQARIKAGKEMENIPIVARRPAQEHQIDMAGCAMIGIVAGTNLLLNPGSDAGAGAATFPPIAGEVEVGMVAAAIDELAEDRRGRRFRLRRRRN